MDSVFGVFFTLVLYLKVNQFSVSIHASSTIALLENIVKNISVSNTLAYFATVSLMI